jgi:hypothetical protein|tara:strand:+ start:151 stop:588 length:438 start_codon:yes stop_codon:yes gene_type:complete
MKKFNLIDIITMLGIAASILLILMFASGCSMKFYKKSTEDVRKCCERVSLHQKQMAQFTRYCKVALFLANSENKKEVGNGVRKGARDAVNVCKFVFGVDSDEDLLAAGDRQDYYKVRSYIYTKDDPSGRWHPPQCDPAEIHCEEF